MLPNLNGLLLICVVLCLVRVLVSASAKKDRSHLLTDTSNKADPVRVKVYNTPAQISGHFKKLMDEHRYGEVTRLGNQMDKHALSEYICPAMTTMENYTNLFGYCKRHDMLPGFLARGNMKLVKKVITEFTTSRSEYYIETDHIVNATALSFNEDRYGRFTGLLNAVRLRTAKDDEGRSQSKETTFFEHFMYSLFRKLRPGENSVPLKRFLAGRGDRLRSKHPITLETLCHGLVRKLAYTLHDPKSQKLLVDLRGQPSLLTSTAFAKGFLIHGESDNRVDLVTYGWSEAIEESLKEEYEHGGEKLWMIITAKFPGKYPRDYPPSEKVRTAALKEFPTKMELEEAWAKENASILLAKLEHLFNLLPTVLLRIVAEYASTWAVTYA